jgi:hypothetical protein
MRPNIGPFSALTPGNANRTGVDLICYFFSTGHRVPVPGPTKTPVFMHWAAAAAQLEGVAVTRVASRARLIDSLHICAPVEHDVGCL